MTVTPSIHSEDALACDYVSETAIGLLDALSDAMTLARPGQDAASFAGDLKRLGDGAAFVAQELEGALQDHEAAQEPHQSTTRPAKTATS